MEVQYPTTGELHQMWGNNPIAMMQQQKQIDLANLFANQSLQKGQQDIDLNSQMNPIKVRQAGLTADTTEAQLPGVQADSRLKGVNANVAEATQQDQIKSKLSELAKIASDNELGMIENQAQTLAYSQNPQQRALGLELLKLHKGIVQEREKIGMQSDAAMRLEAQRGKNQKDLMQMQIDAGRFNKSGGAKTAANIEELLLSGKLNYEKAAVAYSGIAEQAAKNGDLESAQLYWQKANDYHSKHIASKQAGAQVGVGAKPDLEQFGIQTNPTQAPAQFSAPGGAPVQQPAQQKPAALADVQKLYPGVPPEKLKEAYKRKFGVDLQ